MHVEGMVKAVADTQGENQGGFAYDTTHVTGFSHTHDSGTGGVSLSIHIGLGYQINDLGIFNGKFPNICPAKLPRSQPNKLQLELVGQSKRMETRLPEGTAWLF